MSKFEDLILRDDRASQPTPTTGTMVGLLYYVTDEGVTERWSGSAWESYSGSASGVAEDLTTAEMDDSLVLHPDGAGGVEWGPDATGGGGGGGGWGFDLSDYAFTSLSGWTQFGSPTTCDISSVPGWLYLKKNGSGSTAICGVYQAQPSYPFTLDAVVVATTPINSNFERVAGLFVAEATMSGKLEAVHADNNSQIEYAVVAYTNITTFASSPANITGSGTLSIHPPIFYRIVAASTTDVSYYFSYDGVLWRLITASHNPGFTIGAIGLMADPEQTNHAVEHALGIFIH